jgi:hypothetical protein
MAWTNMPSKSNGTVVDAGDWNQMVNNFQYQGGTDGNTKTGLLVVNGAYIQAGTATAASGGQLRLVDDSGTLRFILGMPNNAGERTLALSDQVNSFNVLSYGGTTGTLALASRNSAHITVSPASNAFIPGASGSISCGSAGNMWASVWATTGVVSNSKREDKQVGARVNPAALLGKVKALPIHRFRYLRPDGTPDPDLEHVGFMADDAPPELLVAPGLVNPQTTACYALACVQELAAQVDALKARAPGPPGPGGPP